VSLSHCVSVLKIFFARSAECSRPTAAAAPQMAQRRIHATNPLHLCHFSDISRANRHAKMSIQRFLPCFPPVISAALMQFLQMKGIGIAPLCYEILGDDTFQINALLFS
jgi:hypothetical protein